MGISEKERNYMTRYFHEYYTEENYDILTRCLEVSWKNSWFVAREDGYNVVRIADYLEHTRLMSNWAEKCIEFLKEKENN